MRKPFQGVLNIIRFNWHFYVFAFAIVSLLFLTVNHFDESFHSIIFIICYLICFSTILSLLTSFYVYDISGIYKFNWLDNQNTETTIVNINAGFDETSALLENKFKNVKLIALDFYDPLKHTEISIKRARKAYPPFAKTKQVDSDNLKLPDNSVDKIFVILSAHEIRNENERTIFFKELNRILKPTGQIYITEHLRDIANFLAYNIGFLHFFSKASWLKTFKNSNLKLKNEIKLTPFISTFILYKNGNTL